MISASASFATPIGYQTNTLVYAPGGYRFTDYMRLGVPLNIVVSVLAALLIPVFWSF
jgi:di/tricarboxylate transporter